MSAAKMLELETPRTSERHLRARLFHRPPVPISRVRTKARGYRGALRFWRSSIPEFDENGGWKTSLGKELEAAGFEIDWNIAMRV